MKRSVYLDNAATTYPKPEAVYRAVDGFAREAGGNPGRGGHRRSLEAGRELLNCRESLARLLGAPDPSRVILTANATAALNIAIHGLVGPGGHVITSSLEHNSVLRPLTSRCREAGACFDKVPCGKDGLPDLEEARRLFRPGTCLMVFTHASNVLGTLQPARELAGLAHAHGVPLLLDAAQTAGQYPIDVEGDGIDLLAFSGHKELLGPPGTGGLYISPGIDFDPFFHGGTGSDSTSPEQPSFLPDRFEPGTPNTWGAAGLRAGVRFVLEEGVDAIRSHEEGLTGRLIEGLRALPGVDIYGPSDWGSRVGIVSFNLAGTASTEVAAYLNEVHDIAVRAGLHCSPMAHAMLGTLETGAVRVGFSRMNGPEDVDALLEALGALVGRNP